MLKLYNTLTRKVEPFVPVIDNEVSIYVCGPTVYSDIHIGNARPVIFFDMLKEYLVYLGYKVNYVSNITDIDDKIIEEAKKLNITEKELTTTYTDAFIKATIAVGSKLPDIMPKATDYIDEMIIYISKLIEKDFAYETKSGVYFKINQLDDYGTLSKQDKEMLEANVRIDNQTDKLDFRDFTLWKNTTDGLHYDSPWGKGRPGWHTECAVMNESIFGQMIDIHGGGSDLVFPHHENEMAQTKAHSNHQLSKYWMHVGRVDLSNVKMSKSLGNTVLVKDLIDPISYRLLILNHHYRQPINYSDALMDEMVQMYDRITRTLKRTSLTLGIDKKDDINDEFLKRFELEMNNDMNTPNVITIILEIMRELNKEKDTIILTELYNSLRTILEVFSILPKYKLTKEVLETHSKWIKAREDKNYNLADKLRDELNEEGWI